MTNTTMNTIAKFSNFQKANDLRDSLVKAGKYVTITDIAENLSGEAYKEATKEYRLIVESREFEVGDGATVCGYSDRDAYTVIKRTAKTLTIKSDKTTLLNGLNSGEKDALVCHPGGFCGHVEGTQRYSYEADPKGHTVVARLTKKGWKVKGSRVIAGRNHYYDYNF